MKRGGPLKRNTRLKANPDTARAWERRSRDAARARERETPKARKPGVSDAERAKVRRRSGGWCEARWPEGCGTSAMHAAEHMHHVVLRGQGGPDTADNLLHLCHRVHQHAHDVDRAGAELRGIIRRG